MTEHPPLRTERVDFRATSDPALQQSADLAARRAAGRRPSRSTGSGSASTGRPRTSTSPRTASTGTSASVPRSSVPAHCTALQLVLRRRAARRRRARADHARRRRSEDIRVFRGTQIADEARRVAFFDRFYRHSEGSACSRPPVSQGRLAADLRAPQPRVPRALRRDAPPPRRTAWPSSPRTATTLVEADHDLPHAHRGQDAGAHRPALHHRLQRASRHAARRSWPGLHARRARRAPPRRLRRALPARHGPARTRATPRPPSSARWARRGPVADGRPAPDVDPQGRRRRRRRSSAAPRRGTTRRLRAAGARSAG